MWIASNLLEIEDKFNKKRNERSKYVSESKELLILASTHKPILRVL